MMLPTILCYWIYKKGSYNLSNWMHLTIHYVTCKHGTNLKFGHIILLTWLVFLKRYGIEKIPRYYYIIQYVSTTVPLMRNVALTRK